MSKIPFDIKYRPQIESGEYKVETDCKEPVTIIKWDLKNDNGNILCYYFDGKEDIPYVTEGKDLFIVTPEPKMSEFEKEVYKITTNKMHFKEEANKLLSLANKQLIKDGYVIEKKAFHDAVENISDKHQAEMSVEYSIHCKVKDGTRHAVMNWDEFQKVAQKFIDIGKAEALKDLQDGFANNDIYRVPEWLREVLVMAKENGKEEAMEDLPRWKEIRDNGCVDADGDTYTDCLCLLKRGWYQVMSPGTKVGGEIRYLSIRDLEKLPGFKEDRHE